MRQQLGLQSGVTSSCDHLKHVIVHCCSLYCWLVL